jgi:hypothetical protein
MNSRAIINYTMLYIPCRCVCFFPLIMWNYNNCNPIQQAVVPFVQWPGSGIVHASWFQSVIILYYIRACLSLYNGKSEGNTTANCSVAAWSNILCNNSPYIVIKQSYNRDIMCPNVHTFHLQNYRTKCDLSFNLVLGFRLKAVTHI